MNRIPDDIELTVDYSWSKSKANYVNGDLTSGPMGGTFYGRVVDMNEAFIHELLRRSNAYDSLVEAVRYLTQQAATSLPASNAALQRAYAALAEADSMP